MRSRRSCLSVPGSSEKMLSKARGLDADEIVIDLEDSVAPQAKDDARAAVTAALDAGEWRAATVTVRVNARGTPWQERDLRALAGRAGLDSIVLPKVESAQDVEAAAGLTTGTKLGLQALIETARGLRAAGEIAAAGHGIETLIVGYADLAASLGRASGAEYPGDRWHWVRETVLVAARAEGLQAIDGPHLQVDDPEGLRTEALRARALGYDGKWAIHPSQVETLNEVFGPTAEEYERACAVIAALEDAEANRSAGAVMLDGAMIDEASRKLAADVVARGRAAGL